MATIIGTDLSTIAQAVEQQLLGKGCASDISNIYWVEEGEEPPPGITGQRDILLYQGNDDFGGSQSSTVVGSGRGAAIKSGLKVSLRTSLVMDRPNTRRDWFIAHDSLVNAVIDALFDFFPTDSDENALTIEGFVPVRNNTEARTKSTTTWGYTIASYEFHYCPVLAGGITP